MQPAYNDHNVCRSLKGIVGMVILTPKHHLRLYDSKRPENIVLGGKDPLSEEIRNSVIKKIDVHIDSHIVSKLPDIANTYAARFATVFILLMNERNFAGNLDSSLEMSIRKI